MGQKEKRQTKEEVIELTDVVEEGPELNNSKEMAQVLDESDLDKELNELFSDTPSDTDSQEKEEPGLTEKNSTPTGEKKAEEEETEEEDLDIDSLFEELEKGETVPTDQETEQKTQDLSEELAAFDQEDSAQPEEENMSDVNDDPQADQTTDDFDELLSGTPEGPGEHPAEHEEGLEENLEKVLEDDFDLDKLAESEKEQIDEAPYQEIITRLENLENNQTTQDEINKQIQDTVKDILTEEGPVLQGLQEKITSQITPNLEQLIESKLDSLRNEFLADTGPKDDDNRITELAQQLAALEKKALKSVDVESLKAGLLTELTTALEKLIPQTAARIIREEIQALAEEEDEDL